MSFMYQPEFDRVHRENALKYKKSAFKIRKMRLNLRKMRLKFSWNILINLIKEK